MTTFIHYLHSYSLFIVIILVQLLHAVNNHCTLVEFDFNASNASSKNPDRYQLIEYMTEHNNKFKDADYISTTSQLTCSKNGASKIGDNKNFKMLGFNFSQDMELSSEKCLKPKKTTCFSSLLNVQIPLLQICDPISLRSNITYDFSYQESKNKNLIMKFMFYVVVLLIFGKQMNSINKLQLSQLSVQLLKKDSHLRIDVKISSSIKNINSTAHITECYKDILCKKDKLLNYQWTFNSETQFFMYPVLNMTRLASYRPLCSVESPISFAQLSEAGFRYSGQGHIIVCECCHKSNNIMFITANPVSTVYHNHNCRFIQHDIPSEDEVPVSSSSSQFENTPHANAENETTLISAGGNILHVLVNNLQDYCTKPSDDIVVDSHLFKSQSSIDDSCQNEQKHANYVPIHTLNISHLEKEYQDASLVHLLHICAKLTVKIECKKKKKIVTGSILNNPCEIVSTKNVQLPDIDDYHKELFLKNSALGIVYVVTTSHLLGTADRDLNNTEVTLSLDNDSYREFKLKGLIFSTHKKLGVKQSILICTTCDLNVIKMINGLQQQLKNASRSIPDGLKVLMSRSVFIISHPDGKDKMLSFGKSSLEKYGISPVKSNGKRELFSLRNSLNATLAEPMLCGLLYTAVTCPGSSGAPVITFKRSNAEWILNIWTHNGINISVDRGVTVLKDCLQFSNLNEVVQQNVSTIGVSSSFLTATTVPQSVPRPSDPAYPIYSTKEKRLQSLSNWLVSHIIHPNVLADAGFFYAGYADCVRCFHCGLGLKSWKLGDDVYVEHSRHRPSCSFLQSLLPLKNINSANLLLNQSGVQLQPVTPISSNVTSVGASETAGLPSGSSINNIVTSLHTQLTVSEVTSLAVSGQLDPDESNILLSSSEGNGNNYPHVRTAVTDVAATAISDQNHSAPNKTIATKLLEREKHFLQQLMKCKVCKEAPIKELFLPCGDLYACSECSQKFAQCPLCDKKILGTVTTYFA